MSVEPKMVRENEALVSVDIPVNVLEQAKQIASQRRWTVPDTISHLVETAIAVEQQALHVEGLQLQQGTEEGLGSRVGGKPDLKPSLKSIFQIYDGLREAGQLREV